MNTILNQRQIERYRENGFIVIEDFLSAKELANWREAVDEAVQERKDLRIPGHQSKPTTSYYSKVFTQRVNLWQTNPQIKTDRKSVV